MIQLPIPETTETVMRPVALEVVRQLMQITGLSPKTNIAFFGELEQNKQLNSAIGAEGDDPNKFAHNDKITLEVSEVFSPDRVPNEAVFNPENLLIFNDDALDISMRPVYAWMDASISVKYRASNKNQAIQWRDYMKSKISRNQTLNLHKVSYSFGIREELLYVLKELHRLRENVAGYGESFDEYFKANRAPSMTQLTNQSGTASLWVVPETQVQVQGYFDWELPEESVKDGSGEAVTTSFTYKFFYARPTEVAMIYPIVVHQQLLDQKFRDVPLEDHNDVRTSKSIIGRVFGAFQSDTPTQEQLLEYGYSIPTFDEHRPKMIPKTTRRLITGLVTIDDATSHYLLNLGALGERQFTPDVLAYMRAEYLNLTKPGLCVFNVALYKNEFLIAFDPPAIIIDADLNVDTVNPPDLRVQYHVRISLLTDLELLRNQALFRLQDHGRAAQQILLAIDPTLKERGFLPPLIGDNFVSKTSLLIAIANIRPRMYPATASAQFFTVQTLFVQTQKP